MMSKPLYAGVGESNTPEENYESLHNFIMGTKVNNIITKFSIKVPLNLFGGKE